MYQGISCTVLVSRKFRIGDRNHQDEHMYQTVSYDPLIDFLKVRVWSFRKKLTSFLFQQPLVGLLRKLRLQKVGFLTFRNCHWPIDDIFVRGQKVWLWAFRWIFLALFFLLLQLVVQTYIYSNGILSTLEVSNFGRLIAHGYKHMKKHV